MDSGVRDGMKVLFDKLDGQAKEATEEGRVKVGFDYVVRAERGQDDTEDCVEEEESLRG
jgi:hypothetical protein